MYFHLGHRGGPKKLPRPIHDYIRRRFGVLPEYLEDLRCFEFESSLNGKKVKRFRIDSPIRAQQQNITITGLTDLEKFPSLLLYEGYIEKEGKAYVADRRSPVQIKKQ